MNKYRIVKEIKSHSKEVDYYVEKKMWFLPIWTKCKYFSNSIIDLSRGKSISFETYEEAKGFIDLKKQKTIREVIE